VSRFAALLAGLLVAACGSGGLPEVPPPPLPAAFESLAAGFAAEVVAEGLAKPVRMALAPDGRLFFNELDTGDIRIVDADGTLLPTPFAHLDVLNGGHYGLLGLALAPDFAVSGHLFVSATCPAEPGHADRVRVVRFTDVSNLGTNLTVIVDDLPLGAINDAGDLAFDLLGNLFLSLGDANDAANAQSDLSLAGKVLRYTAAGAVPADNPDPASPEWCRGLRNSFALAVHPTTGDLFGADNGPASDDELNYLQGAKNFGWPSLPPGVGGSEVGFRIAVWPTVIVPTAIAWHTGAGWGAEYEDDLFLATYEDETIERIGLSGAARTDLDFEEVFASFVKDGLSNKPLDLLVAADGSLWVSTFTGIYRIRRLP
jgi:glucose/arabinose dehydrogenase